MPTDTLWCLLLMCSVSKCNAVSRCHNTSYTKSGGTSFGSFTGFHRFSFAEACQNETFQGFQVPLCSEVPQGGSAHPCHQHAARSAARWHQALSCFRPMPATRVESGSVFVGRPSRGPERESFNVPCGICMGCRLDHARSWAVRCTHEAQCWRSSVFLTLTYDDDHLPRHGSLEKSHLQLFMKRLRKSISGELSCPDSPSRKPIRFFACGEYGSQTNRAHYHLLLFNLAVPNPVVSSKTTFRSELFAETWRYGNHEFGAVTPRSTAYVAGYSVKKLRMRYASQDEIDRRYGALDPETGEFVLRAREFSLSSRRPGIGAHWLSAYHGDLRRGFVMHGGNEAAVPRYYKRRLADRDPLYAEAVAEAAFKRAQSIPLEERTERRRQDREEVAVRRQHFFSGGTL